MSVNSPFIQHLENEVSKIKNICKSPKLVVDKYNELLNIHNQINNDIDDYVDKSALTIKKEITDNLREFSNTFKTSYKEDLKRLSELNKTVLNSKTSFKIKYVDNMVNKSIESIKPTMMYDVDIYDDLLDVSDPNMTDKTINSKDNVAKVKKFNAMSEEITDGLDDIVDDVKEFEKNVMSLKGNVEQEGMNQLKIMYVIHLNYLNDKLNKTNAASKFKINGNNVPFVKQTEFISKYFNNSL